MSQPLQIGPRPVRDLLGDCVHCGFCLQACPTYQLWGEEMDSPRGRIHLMRGLTEGDELVPETVGHFDACLGCMACMTACPSGVEYDKLIEHTRAQVETETSRKLPDRAIRGLIFALFPHPRRLRRMLPLLRLAQRTGAHRLGTIKPMRRLFPRLAAMASLAPEVPARAQRARAIGSAPASAPARGRVAVLTGCVQDAFFAHVNRATVALLNAEGIDVVVPGDQGCCGALGLHTGREAQARAMAARVVDQIPEDVDAIITNAAGCGSSLKSYGDLLAGDPVRADKARAFASKVRDITEYLAEVEPVAPRQSLPLRVAYHDACHLAHAQGVRRQPRDLIATIPGVELAEITEPDMCCGSAGVYNILNPEAATKLGRRKADFVARTGAQVVAAGNPGCLMQLMRELPDGAMVPLHTVELLAASVDPAAASALLDRVGKLSDRRDPG
jgi:glycolate oxidase iron-sulfur subunit